MDLISEVRYIKGVGAERAEILAKKGILTAEDLLYYIPFRYEDRTRVCGPGEVRPGQMATVIAEVMRAAMLPVRRRSMRIFRAVVERDRRRLNCKWFNASYLQKIIRPGQHLALYGKVEEDHFEGGFQMVQPQYEILPGSPEEMTGAENFLEIGRIVPIYEAMANGRLTSRFFRRVIHFILENLSGMEDPLPLGLAEKYPIIPRWQAIRDIHFPPPGTKLSELAESRSAAHRRLIFEEFFFLESRLALRRKHARQAPGIAFLTDTRIRECLKKVLPFHPTEAQKKALAEIVGDMRAPQPMQRLLQGEVGSGKTIVALQAAIVAIENGYQVVMMAPTEVLATQHFLYFRRLLAKSGHHVILLSGSATAREKKGLKRLLRDAAVQLAIGTHALVEEDVELPNLGLVIIDEQHRFGVMQRLHLMQKGRTPDTLVMTATPIPRTLAMTMYGDLDISVISQLPAGRLPITTRQIPDESASIAYEFVRSQVASGAQAFIVYPVIEDSAAPEKTNPSRESLSRVSSRDQRAATMLDAQKDELFPSDYASQRTSGDKAALSGNLSRESPSGAQSRHQRTVLFDDMPTPKKSPTRSKKRSATADLKSAMKMYGVLSKQIFPELRLGLLHGRMTADEKEKTMQAFQAGEIQILVGTTVIEVGIDVPNATVMVVEQAERFGLTQLHQLRGRVGRGKRQSHCLLITSANQTEAAQQRLAALERTNDGFELAELDLRLRGPGEFLGTKQSGMPALRIANLLRDREVLEAARRLATDFLEQGSESEVERLKNYIRGTWDRRYGLVNVG